MASQRSVVLEILVYIVMICVGFALFHRFTVQNTERIQHQNMVYAEDAVRQKVERVEGQFLRTTELIKIYASMLGHMLTSPEVTPKMLKELEQGSPFDAIRFTNLEGINMATDGTLTPSADREFFIEGMKGNSNMMIALKSRVMDQSTLIVYAPVYYNDKIIGVLHGTYLSDQYMRPMLQTSYFGTSSEVFLCTLGGDIIAASDDSSDYGNVLQLLSAKNILDEKTIDETEKVFQKGGTAIIECGPESPVDNLCVMRLPHYNFVIVQIFPQSVTTAMVENANKAGVQLEIGLITLFACYAAFLILRARRQKKKLEKENREFSWVIKGLNLLFESRYCLVNFNEASYSYIVGQGPVDKATPDSGNYDILLDNNARVIMGDNERRAFREFFLLPSLEDHLKKEPSVTYACHVERDGKAKWENLIIICVDRENGKPARALLVCQDITEMKQRDLQARKTISILDRKDRQYQLAVTSNALCNYEFNVSRDLLEEDITIRDRNGDYSLLSQLNLRAPCPITEVFEGIISHALPEYREELKRMLNLNYLRGIYAKGQREVDLDFWIKLGKEGEEECIRHAFYLTADNLSGDIMALVVARDITGVVLEQRKQTKALQDALLLAQHASEAKSTFLSNMSHDIRTPMNAIIGFATIAVGHLDSRDQVRDCLQKVLSSSNHLLSLINDILDMSRIESGKMQIKEQECNISDLVHNIVTIIQPQTKAKKMKLFIDTFDVSNERVITDPLKMNQVFINLLSNAVKYTPSGGSISFRLSQKTNFRHGYADYVFVISDNGQGMSPEFVKHIFEPFTRETTTTLSGIQGTGLGMAITRNIVRMMGGTIDVESELGKGSVFTVVLTLKVVEGAAEDDTLDGGDKLRALVVDDDMHACDSVDKMLKKIGLRSEWTTSGQEAVYRAQIAYNDGDPYTTYIIDWQMPEMNGLELTRQIRRIVGEDAPIIILTAYEWTDIEEDARQAGVTAFCAKPLFMSDLKSALKASHNLGPKEEEKQEETNQFENARILVVDDVEMNREIAEFILTESGFTVELAADGSDAVTMVEESPENYYDAILMDVQMPTMNGYETTRAIRAMDRSDVKRMPIIAMTANALDEDRAAALKSGMDAHIAKPLDIKVFFEVLQKFFNRKN